MKLNQSVQRATAILRAAAERPTGDTASGLARSTGLPHSTALRVIHTLESEGFLTRQGNGHYVIGLVLARLGHDAGHGHLLDATARAALDRVAAETQETVTLSVVRGRDDLDVVLQVDTPQHVAFVIDEDKLDQLGGRKFMRIINEVNGRLTTSAMIEMNRDVDVDGQDPAVVAERFLRTAGLLEGPGG